MPANLPLKRIAASALALSLGLALSACGGIPTNRALDSVHQPIVQRNSFTFDASTLPGGGLSISEQRRLSDWFEVLDLRYGDKIAVDDPLESPSTRNSVEVVANRFSMMVSGIAPVTTGEVLPGTVRIVVTRTVASVPGCPDWSAKSDANPSNATSKNYGCAINGNLAAMVANKEDLVHGARGTGQTVVMSNSKAIDAYRAKEPTGKGGLKEVSSKSGGN